MLFLPSSCRSAGSSRTSLSIDGDINREGGDDNEERLSSSIIQSSLFGESADGGFLVDWSMSCSSSSDELSASVSCPPPVLRCKSELGCSARVSVSLCASGGSMSSSSETSSMDCGDCAGPSSRSAFAVSSSISGLTLFRFSSGEDQTWGFWAENWESKSSSSESGTKPRSRHVSICSEGSVAHCFKSRAAVIFSMMSREHSKAFCVGRRDPDVRKSG